MTIELYTWSTPNGRKVSVMLEEVGLAYSVHPINIGKGEQLAADFLAISPNGKIPAIVDPDGPGGRFPLFESGAILIYLAEKTGQLLPREPRARYTAIQWLMFQMGGVGPMFGQAHHFMRFAKEKVPYGIERYGKETRRLYGVMDKRLSEAAFLAGDGYTIADIATFPWVARYEYHQVSLSDFPNVERWYRAIAARPAVVRGMAVPA
jgi:GST-like protein